MYEPVPGFFAELSTHWDKYIKELGYDATLYNYGLGKNNRYSIINFTLVLPFCLWGCSDISPVF